MNTSGFQKSTVPARISLSSTRAAYVGPGLNLTPHRNVAATVALALQTPFELEILDQWGRGTAGSTEHIHIALIPAGARHHLRASGPMAFIYLDALSDDHEQFRKLDLPAAHARLTQDHRDALLVSDVDRLCSLLGVPARTVKDVRIAEVVRCIDQCPQAFVRISDAASLAGVSVSRFQDLFCQSVGVPFRRYRLWKRMAVVMRAVSAGETLTDAAFEAGFSSSAHLSTTFRAMFGLTPSSVVALNANIEFTVSELLT